MRHGTVVAVILFKRNLPCEEVCILFGEWLSHLTKDLMFRALKGGIELVILVETHDEHGQDGLENI